MDYYRHLLKHFKWTWLESRKGHYHSGWGARNRKHDRTPTKLARNFAKKLVRREIENET